MNDSKIQKLTSELEKEIYKFKLNLSDGLFLSFERNSLKQYPQSNMVFYDLETKEGYAVPLYKPANLKSMVDVRDSIKFPEVDLSEDQKRYKEETLKEFSKDISDAELKYLKGLPEALSQEVREAALDRIKEAKKYEKEKYQKIDEHFSEMEDIEKFYDFSKIKKKVAKVTGTFFNIICFGSFNRDFKWGLDHNTTQVIAWDVLTKITDELYQTCEENARYLKETGNSELSEKIDEIARFYGNISYHADFGKKYMSRLRDREVSEFGEMVNYTSPNLDSISKQILSKTNNRDLTFSFEN